MDNVNRSGHRATPQRLHRRGGLHTITECMFCKFFLRNGVFKMKNKWFLILGVLLVFGSVFVSCDTGNDPNSDSLDGIWETTDTSYGINRFTISGNNWTLAIGSSLTETNKGTLRVEDKTMTFTVTHQKTSAGGDWVLYSSSPRIGTLSDDGKSFDLQGGTFVKK
jgi:hypothetical protein